MLIKNVIKINVNALYYDRTTGAVTNVFKYLHLLSTLSLHYTYIR